jgi:hypothetical protein
LKYSFWVWECHSCSCQQIRKTKLNILEEGNFQDKCRTCGKGKRLNKLNTKVFSTREKALDYIENPSVYEKDREDAPEFLLKEKNIEKLRDVCITVYMNYHHQWDAIVQLSKKRHKRRINLLKINKLQSQINKLREELE